MITKFTFPSMTQKRLKSIGEQTTHFRIKPKQMAKEMLFWSDLYTIIYNFLGADIDTFEEAKTYFLDAIDFDCVFECKDKKINIASAFYFYFD